MHAIAEVIENKDASRLTLVHTGGDTNNSAEELILKVQGYIVDAKLPPIRTYE